MRHGSSSRRQRSRSNGGRRGGNQKRSQVYDSNGPDVRIRGTAHQVCDKYLTLAKDAISSGDIILAESYYQHAEHYQRIINSWDDEGFGADRQNRQSQNEQQRSAPEKNASEDEDLSLPSSILGENSKAEASAKEKERTLELSDA